MKDQPKRGSTYHLSEGQRSDGVHACGVGRLFTITICVSLSLMVDEDLRSMFIAIHPLM